MDALAPYAVIPGGQQARATNYNQHAFASGGFARSDDVQHSHYVLRNAWAVTVQADAVNNSLSIIVSGAGAVAVRWVAHVRTVEVRL